MTSIITDLIERSATPLSVVESQFAAQLNPLTTVLEFRRISGMPTEGIPESIEGILGELQQISFEE